MSARNPACVVLGGGGFIGINLCRRLVASGHRVRAFGRRFLFPDDMQGIELYEGDFTDPGTLATAIDRFDIVFHLIHSTVPQAANLDMAADLQKNVIPSIALFDLCRKLNIERVVYASSGGTIYGCPTEIPTPETAPTEPIGAYGISKLAIEKYLALHQRLYGLDFRALRITNPFGPFQVDLKNQGFISATIARALANERLELWGDGSVVRDFVFVDDVVDALMAAAVDRGDEKIFNVGSGQGRSLREVILSIEQSLQTILQIEPRSGRIVDVPYSAVSIERAQKHLNWAPKTPFQVGLQRTIDWQQKRRKKHS